MATNKKGSSKKSKDSREVRDTGTDKRYVRSDAKVQFKDAVSHKAIDQGVRGEIKVGRYMTNSSRAESAGPKAGKRHLSEDEVEKRLEAQGAIRLPTLPRSSAPRPAPINVPGKPVSETIIEERR